MFLLCLMFQQILDDLKAQFGSKIQLSPEDIEAIINVSAGQQANQRSQGRFPIPYTKDGGRIRISSTRWPSILQIAVIAIAGLKSSYCHPIPQELQKNPTEGICSMFGGHFVASQSFLLLEVPFLIWN